MFRDGRGVVEAVLFSILIILSLGAAFLPRPAKPAAEGPRYILTYPGGSITFSEASGLTSRSEVQPVPITVNGRTVTHLTAAAPLYESLVLRRPLVEDLSLAEWRRQVEAGSMETAVMNATLTLVDGKSRPVARWRLLGTWPSRLSVILPTDDQPGMEEIELVFSQVERASP